MFSTVFGNMLVGRMTTDRTPATNGMYFTMTPTQAINKYLDVHNLIRCAGRFQFAPLSANEKRPILIPAPKTSRFVTLLVEHYHALTFHAGTARTLHALRRKFWITAGRRAVFNVVHKCPKCKRFIARPYPQPTKSDLPDMRLNETSPYANIGIDTFGPLYLKQMKYFGLIVTDLVIRAIDLELLPNMTSTEIGLALRRVFARHRLPEQILSDNAPQFLQLEKEFQATFTHAWAWKMLPAHSPWMGGAYERLIALVKSSIMRTFYNEELTESSLRTAFAEIASSLNARPLTYVSADAEDEPLTPAHFLQVPCIPPLPEQDDLNAIQVRTYLKQAIEIRNKFWNVWKSAYLQYLREQAIRYHFPNQTATFAPRTGDIVLISAPLQKRDKWNLGRIVRLYESKDNAVRSAAVKMKNGIVIRPLTELYPLELRSEIVPPQNIEPMNEWDEPEISVEVIE